MVMRQGEGKAIKPALNSPRKCILHHPPRKPVPPPSPVDPSNSIMMF
jgi:hypothetical protein